MLQRYRLTKVTAIEMLDVIGMTVYEYICFLDL